MSYARAFVAGLVLVFAVLIPHGSEPLAATCSYVGSAPYCPLIETVFDLTHGNSGVAYVYTSGYTTAGDSGGGVLYALQPPIAPCSPNNGSVVKDSTSPVPNCYLAQTFPQNVMQWGAQCNTTQTSAPGVITSAQPEVLGAPGQLSLQIGEPIVITGALANGGTLATTVRASTTPLNVPSATTPSFSGGTNVIPINTSSATVTNLWLGASVVETDSGGYIPASANAIVVGVTTGSSQSISISSAIAGGSIPSLTLSITGTTIPLNDPATATTPIPSWVADTVSSVSGSPGTTVVYHVGDIETLLDGPGGTGGTQVQVLTLNSSTPPAPQTVEVIVPQFVLSFRPSGNTVGDTNSGISGNSVQYKISYFPSGQIWYGNDDTSAIQAALTASAAAPVSGLAVPSDIYLPANLACGVTSTINLPQGVESLRGYGADSSEIVLLKMLSTTPDPHSYLLLRSGGANGVSGGGARELHAEALMLATDVVGVESGQNETYLDVRATDGTSEEWRCGGDTNYVNTQMAGDMFLHIQGDRDHRIFPFHDPVHYPGQNSLNNWTTDSQCTWASVISSEFQGAVNVGIQDLSGEWNVYSDDEAGTGQTSYCAELYGQQHITNLLCRDPQIAGVHLAEGGHAVVQGVNVQFANTLPGVACGVKMENGLDNEYVSGVQLMATNAPVQSGNVICSAALGPNTIISGNPSATFVAPGASAWTPLANGQVYLSLNPTSELQLCPLNGPGGLIINTIHSSVVTPTMQQITTNCVFLPVSATGGAGTQNYIYAKSEQQASAIISEDITNTLIEMQINTAGSGLTDGDSVIIAGAPPNSFANGTWRISHTTVGSGITTFDLVGSGTVFATGWTGCTASSTVNCGNTSYVTLIADTSTSASSHETVNGVEVNSHHNDWTLVGAAFVDSTGNFADVPTERYVASWYNRQPKKCLTTLPANSTLASITFQEINTAMECKFFNWGPGAGTPGNSLLNWTSSGQLAPSMGSGGGITTAGFDGPPTWTVQPEQSSMLGISTAEHFPLAVTGSTNTLSEGEHVITLLGRAQSFSGAVWMPVTTLEADPLQ